MAAIYTRILLMRNSSFSGVSGPWDFKFYPSPEFFNPSLTSKKTNLMFSTRYSIKFFIVALHYDCFQQPSLEVKAMTKCVCRGALGETGPAHRPADGSLQCFLVNVIAAHLAVRWVYCDLVGGKHVLPTPHCRPTFSVLSPSRVHPNQLDTDSDRCGRHPLPAGFARA